MVSLHAQDKPAYRIVDANGKKTTWAKAVAQAKASEAVCFGELHNNPIAHWLELELVRDLAGGGKTVTVGMEMYERHQQPWLDRLYSGSTTLDAMQDSAGMWPNFATDYKPIVAYSLENKQVKVVATNVTRKYASMVAKKGPQSLDTLSAAEKSQFAPLPLTIDYELACYKEMAAMMAGHGGSMKPEHFVAAQALKDATMAHFLLAARHPTDKNEVLVHFNGSFHSDRKEGIVWYLKRAQPTLNVLTITVIEQESLDQLEPDNKGLADFIIIVPARMTKTYE
jgi:uncharacterized iron-regulated protein